MRTIFKKLTGCGGELTSAFCLAQWESVTAFESFLRRVAAAFSVWKEFDFLWEVNLKASAGFHMKAAFVFFIYYPH